MTWSRYRTVTLAFFMLFLALAVIDGVRVLERLAGPQGYPWFPWHLFAYAMLAAPFGVLLILKETRYTTVFLVAAITLSGYAVAVLHRADHITAELLVVAAAAVGYRLKLLSRRPILVLLVLFGGLILVRLATAFAAGNVSLFRLANQLTITLFVSLFAYWVFEEDLLRLRREQEMYRRELESVIPFAEFGRNIAGVVHDFKNDAALFSALTSVTRQSIGKEIDQNLIDTMDRSARRLNNRIEMILTATSGGRGEYKNARFELQKVVDASVYVFQLHVKLKHLIAVHPDPDVAGTTIRGNAGNLAAILENVIRNSCDAVLEKAGNSVTAAAGANGAGANGWEPRVDLRYSSREIVITDNGPGLPFCPGRCRHDNCLVCPAMKLGRSTKPGGSGIGLFRIRAAAEKLGVDLLMRSVPGEGVTTRIVFPSDNTENSTDSI